MSVSCEPEVDVGEPQEMSAFRLTGNTVVKITGSCLCFSHAARQLSTKQYTHVGKDSGN